MHPFYNLGVRLYGFGIRITSLFNAKAKKWIIGRSNQLETMPNLVNQEVYWFHCASLGEFDMALPLMNKIRQEISNAYIVATFFSPSGMEHYHKRQHPIDLALYLPLDTPKKARIFIKKLNPKYGFFIKYEFWSNHIFEAKRQGTKLYNISGIFWKHHRFFKFYGRFFRKTLRKFDHLFVQNQNSEKLLNSIKINNVSVTGDSRYDRVIENKSHAVKEDILDSFAGQEKLFIAGSTWPEDEKILIPVVNEIHDKVIIAPHDISEEHITNIEIELDRSHVRFTNLEQNPDLKADILILDTIGHLANAYGYGKYAYVGGGFSGSLHNILEPAVFGLPVIFGPKHNKFPEAQQFIDEQIGFSISTFPQLKKIIQKFESNSVDYGQSIDAFVQNQSGATEKIFAKIFTSN